MTFKTVLIGYLPTRWSKVTAGSTIALVGMEVTLHRSLPSSVVSTWDKEALLFLTIAILLTLLFGTFITLLLTVPAYHKINKGQDKMRNKETYIRQIIAKQYDEITSQILQLFFNSNHDLSIEYFIPFINSNINIIRHHFDVLLKDKLIRQTKAAQNSAWLGTSRQAMYALTDTGREYVIKNKAT